VLSDQHLLDETQDPKDKKSGFLNLTLAKQAGYPNGALRGFKTKWPTAIVL
jgi:hypothetical protein